MDPSTVSQACSSHRGDTASGPLDVENNEFAPSEIFDLEVHAANTSMIVAWGFAIPVSTRGVAARNKGLKGKIPDSMARSSLKDLEFLDLGQNMLSQRPQRKLNVLCNFSKLRTLILESNPLEAELPEQLPSACPLLTILRLGNTTIESIPDFSGHHNLEELDLSGASWKKPLSLQLLPARTLRVLRASQSTEQPSTMAWMKCLGNYTALQELDLAGVTFLSSSFN